MIPGLGRSLGEGNGNSLQSSCLENLHGQRSLAGFSPGATKRDKTEQKAQHISDRRLISKYLRNSYNSNKLNLEKAEEPEIKLPTFAES